jgi:predicted polyphosphate/ATP-dependent NAD kinase
VQGRLGLIVNPIAGMGGRVGLKGTDGKETLRRARALGAEPLAAARTDRALARLERCRDELAIVAGAGSMGGDVARARGFATGMVAAGALDETTAADTRAAAAEMARSDVDLILFAGGDGTSRDIVDVIGTQIPILGIPTGVKMSSGVFATSPEAAGDIVFSTFSGARPLELRDAEVMDVDEDALRDGRVSARLHAVARVPHDRARVQNPKAASRSGDVELDALCRDLAAEAAADGLMLFGPGTTTKRILTHLGLEGTPLGVDAVERGELLGSDLNEIQLLELLADRDARLIVAVVGGQGFVFGRGNQQLSPAVIRRVGLENLVLLASVDKVVSLDPPVLRVDTGDLDLDRELAGYRAVRVAPNRSLVMRISP